MFTSIWWCVLACIPMDQYNIGNSSLDHILPDLKYSNTLPHMRRCWHHAAYIAIAKTKLRHNNTNTPLKKSRNSIPSNKNFRQKMVINLLYSRVSIPFVPTTPGGAVCNSCSACPSQSDTSQFQSHRGQERQYGAGVQLHTRLSATSVPF